MIRGLEYIILLLIYTGAAINLYKWVSYLILLDPNGVSLRYQMFLRGFWAILTLLVLSAYVVYFWLLSDLGNPNLVVNIAFYYTFWGMFEVAGALGAYKIYKQQKVFYLKHKCVISWSQTALNSPLIFS